VDELECFVYDINSQFPDLNIKLKTSLAELMQLRYYLKIKRDMAQNLTFMNF
jgi:hypothetical protein